MKYLTQVSNDLFRQKKLSKNQALVENKMTDELFKALVIEETDDKKYTRQILNKTINDLPPGDVVVEVHYSSLNYKDALSASGNKGVTRSYPHTPGIDAAGVVAESSDSSFKPGDDVIVTSYDLGMNTAGGFGQYIRVPGQWVVPLPKGLTSREAMCYGTAGFTAALSVFSITAWSTETEGEDSNADFPSLTKSRSDRAPSVAC